MSKITNETLHAIHRTTHKMALTADDAGAAITRMAEVVGTNSIGACADGSAEAQADLLRTFQAELPAVDVAVTAWLRSIHVDEAAINEVSNRLRSLAKKLSNDAYTIDRAIANGDVEIEADPFEELIRDIFGPDVEITRIEGVAYDGTDIHVEPNRIVGS